MEKSKNSAVFGANHSAIEFSRDFFWGGEGRGGFHWQLRPCLDKIDPSRIFPEFFACFEHLTFRRWFYAVILGVTGLLQTSRSSFFPLLSCFICKFCCFCLFFLSPCVLLIAAGSQIVREKFVKVIRPNRTPRGRSLSAE